MVVAITQSLDIRYLSLHQSPNSIKTKQTLLINKIYIYIWKNGGKIREIEVGWLIDCRVRDHVSDVVEGKKRVM